MDKLIKMDSKYDILLSKYEEQMKINAELKKEIADVRRELSLYKDNPTSTVMPSEMVSETVHELNERLLREKNLMIFGAAELESGESDNTLVSDIILKAHPEANISNIKIFRIGRVNTTAPRPIKVILESSSEVKSIIRRAKELKKVQLYNNIYLSFDRTRKQIDEYKALKGKLEARLRGGETNLKIKYFNGCPRIVKLDGDLN